MVAYPIAAAVATLSRSPMPPETPPLLLLARVPAWEDDASGDGRSDCVTSRDDGKE